MKFDRKKYFDAIRSDPFDGSLTQEQVDGQEAILGAWERSNLTDLRWLAYMLTTAFHETAQRMWPIEEYGKGRGHAYGEPDPETGETYYGRGLVQLTWKDNYAKAMKELGLTGKDDLVLNPERALDPQIASDIMFRGMQEGWFRPPHTLGKYFNATVDDPTNAREIINGDVSSQGAKLAGYHKDFLAALQTASVAPIKVKIELKVTSSTPIEVEIVDVTAGTTTQKSVAPAPTRRAPMPTGETVRAEVKPATSSKINWANAVSLVATLLTVFTGGKVNLSPETQTAIITAIATATPILTIILRTFFSKDVVGPSVKS